MLEHIDLMNEDGWSAQWYGIYTKSQHEWKVADYLQGLPVEPFLPSVKSWSRRRDRRKIIQRPLFPGYLFIHCAMDKYLYIDVLNIPGVVRILGHGWPMLHTVPKEQIESIQVVLKKDIPISYFPYLTEGSRVRVIDGPLTGAEGFILRTNSKKSKLIISVDILNRSVEIEIDSWTVEAI
jgi:transcription termination/antitermination protein NusG